MLGYKTSVERIADIKKARLNGYSLKQICKMFNMSKSTVSGYIQGLRKNNPTSGSGRYMKELWQNRYSKIMQEALIEFEKIRIDPEMSLFIGLYWGEGSKANKHIGITNNDPSIIRLCYKIFRKFSPHKMISITIFCYPDHNKEDCERFWKALLNVETVSIRDALDQRSKPATARVRARCPFGRCEMRYCHCEFYWRLMTWLKCFKELV
jgi:transcriptional regulator with XRE-family HTH domain